MLTAIHISNDQFYPRIHDIENSINLYNSLWKSQYPVVIQQENGRSFTIYSYWAW
jgi:hypothetical protein